MKLRYADRAKDDLEFLTMAYLNNSKKLPLLCSRVSTNLSLTF